MSQLHVFHLWLCRHVRFNFGPANKAAVVERFGNENPQFVANLDIWEEQFDYDQLATEIHGKFPNPATVAAEAGQRQPLLLNDREFQLLHDLINSLSLRHRRTLDIDHWAAGLQEHYDRAINCLREVATNLSSHEAEVWTSRSRQFADQLLVAGIAIEDGVDVVRSWTAEIRRLLKAMNRVDLLPRPEGLYPTPSTFALPVTPRQESGPASIPSGLKEADVHRVRQAMGELGSKTSPRLIRKQAKMNNQTCRKILRYLHVLGEYRGFGDSNSQAS